MPNSVIRSRYYLVVCVLAIGVACGGAPTESGTPQPPAPSPPATPPATPPVGSNRVSFGEVAGVWTGVAQEMNPTFTYRVRIAIPDSGTLSQEAGTVVYADSGYVNPLPLNCTGTLTLRDTIYSTYSFLERITIGQNCVSGGSVRLRASARDTLLYEWFGRTGAAGAVTRLARVVTP